MTRSDNHFRHCLESGHFALSAELSPPRGAELESLGEAVAILQPAVTAINLTDAPGARVRMSSLAAAIHLKQSGVEPILQMTCRDRNRIAIQSDLLGAAAFGIRNLLVLTGDGVASGDDPDATPVFDFNSLSLLAAVSDMNRNATTVSGSVLTSAPDLFCGTADTPIEPQGDWAPEALLAKASAGARFVQTQFCFDMDLLERYMQALASHGVTEQLYFLVGLGPLRSVESARWMRDNLHGTVMPDGIIRRMQAARDPQQEGIEICAELIGRAREIPGISGAHLMAPGQPQAIVDAVRLAGML
jgi:methylenetetrahydrofolate reductase (NADPH)